MTCRKYFFGEKLKINFYLLLLRPKKPSPYSIGKKKNTQVSSWRKIFRVVIEVIRLWVWIVKVFQTSGPSIENYLMKSRWIRCDQRTWKYFFVSNMLELDNRRVLFSQFQLFVCFLHDDVIGWRLILPHLFAPRLSCLVVFRFDYRAMSDGTSSQMKSLRPSSS